MDAPPKPATIDEVLIRVAAMLLGGARDDDIQRTAKAEGWKQKPKDIKKAIATALDNFVELLGVDQTTALGTALARLNHILAKSLQIQDYKTAFSIQNEITALMLTSPDVILGPETGPKTGRPLAEVDDRTVYGMAIVGANNCEIAQVCGLTEGAIRQRFGETLKAARANMKKKLRRAQLAKALEGNPTMLIWLGKQMLGQRDKADLTSDGNALAAQIHIYMPDNLRARGNGGRDEVLAAVRAGAAASGDNGGKPGTD